MGPLWDMYRAQTTSTRPSTTAAPEVQSEEQTHLRFLRLSTVELTHQIIASWTRKTHVCLSLECGGLSFKTDGDLDAHYATKHGFTVKSTDLQSTCTYCNKHFSVVSERSGPSSSFCVWCFLFLQAFTTWRALICSQCCTTFSYAYEPARSMRQDTTWALCRRCAGQDATASVNRLSTPMLEQRRALAGYYGIERSVLNRCRRLNIEHDSKDAEELLQRDRALKANGLWVGLAEAVNLGIYSAEAVCHHTIQREAEDSLTDWHLRQLDNLGKASRELARLQDDCRKIAVTPAANIEHTVARWLKLRQAADGDASTQEGCSVDLLDELLNSLPTRVAKTSVAKQATVKITVRTGRDSAVVTMQPNRVTVDYTSRSARSAATAHRALPQVSVDTDDDVGPNATHAKTIKSLYSQSISDHHAAVLRPAVCSICTNRLPRSLFLATKLTSDCSHDNDACRQCVREWIATQLEYGNWDDISCLATDCNGVLSQADVYRHASPNSVQRFDRLALQACLRDDPNFVWCIAGDCDSGQIHVDGEDAPIFQCQECGFRYCTVHQEPWHEGLTCTQYDRRVRVSAVVDRVAAAVHVGPDIPQRSTFKQVFSRFRHATRQQPLSATPAQPMSDEALAARQARKAEEALGEAKVKQMAKQCPKCRYFIEKSDGCDHMTCRKCKYEFCWLCLANYKPIRRYGNRMHASRCRYHS